MAIVIDTAMNRQRGVGMVEILVALLVLSIGVLGYAGLQLRALNSTDEAYLRSQATAIGQDVVERIMANPEATGTYTTESNWPAAGAVPATMPQTCVNSKCTATQVADWDIDQTAWQAANLLPGGQITVSACAGSASTCVRVAWGENVPADCEDNSGVVSDVDCVVLEVVP